MHLNLQKHLNLVLETGNTKKHHTILLVQHGQCNTLAMSEIGPRGKPNQLHVPPGAEAQRTSNSPQGFGVIPKKSKLSSFFVPLSQKSQIFQI